MDVINSAYTLLNGTSSRYVPLKPKRPLPIGNGLTVTLHQEGSAYRVKRMKSCRGGGGFTLGLARVVPVAFLSCQFGGGGVPLNLAKLDYYITVSKGLCPLKISKKTSRFLLQILLQWPIFQRFIPKMRFFRYCCQKY